MTRLLLDTHVLAWSLLDDPALSRGARLALGAADEVSVSAASVYEIVYKSGRGQWPEIAPFATDLEARILRDGALLLPITAAIAQRAGAYDWPHRDPFDRLIAATAQVVGLALLSADPAFDGVPGGLHRIW